MFSLNCAFFEAGLQRSWLHVDPFIKRQRLAGHSKQLTAIRFDCEYFSFAHKRYCLLLENTLWPY